MPAGVGTPIDAPPFLLDALGPALWARRDALGSNAWVIAPSRTSMGRALLANDPHLAVSSPSPLYTLRLDAQGLHVAGVTLPGFPCVIIGRNERIAWGSTALEADTEDLFLERVDPHDPSRYMVEDGRSEPFERRRETIDVAGDAPHTFVARATRHGPVISLPAFRDTPVAVRWVGLAMDDTTLDALIDVSHASDWTSFQQALTRFVTPPLDFVYADVDGHIGSIAAGRVPARAPGCGVTPTNGADAPGGYPEGFVPAAAMPRSFDPEEGFIVAANNRVSDDPEAPYLGSDWGPPFRTARIRAMLQATPRASFEDVARMQADVDDPVAPGLLPLVRALAPRAQRERDAVALLRRWNGAATPDSAAAAIFTAWSCRLLLDVVADDLGDEPRLVDAYTAQWQAWWALTAIVRRSDDPLCDDRSTPAHETCVQIAARALTEAVDELAETQGPTPAAWTVARYRTISFDDAVGAHVPVVGRIFTRRAGVGGGNLSTRIAAASPGYPPDVVVSSSMFAIFDLSGRVADAAVVIAPGESGHPLSPHYDDQLARWSANAPAPVANAGGPRERLVLEPAR
jgi:penicillin amidase